MLYWSCRGERTSLQVSFLVIETRRARAGLFFLLGHVLCVFSALTFLNNHPSPHILGVPVVAMIAKWSEDCTRLPHLCGILHPNFGEWDLPAVG